MRDWINPETLGVAVLAALIAHLVFIGLRWLWLYAVDLGEEHWIMAVFEEVLNWMGLAALAYTSLSVVFRNLRHGRALALAQWYLEKTIDERSSVEEPSEDAQGADAEKGEDERGQ